MLQIRTIIIVDFYLINVDHAILKVPTKKEAGNARRAAAKAALKCCVITTAPVIVDILPPALNESPNSEPTFQSDEAQTPLVRNESIRHMPIIGKKMTTSACVSYIPSIIFLVRNGLNTLVFRCR